MDYPVWEPYYRKIREEFGYSQEDDEAVARELDRLLGGARAKDGDLRRLLAGQTVSVLGNGPRIDKVIDQVEGVLVTADEATSAALEGGRKPAILVTDLDGDVEDQIRANGEGTIAVVHGHGDNSSAVRKWAPRFQGRTMATTQSEPTGRLRNFGGFTDGDRAVFLADHYGASSIRLVGWDFEHPSPKDSPGDVKRRKLGWAYILLQTLHRPELAL